MVRFHSSSGISYRALTIARGGGGTQGKPRLIPHVCLLVCVSPLPARKVYTTTRYISMAKKIKTVPNQPLKSSTGYVKGVGTILLFLLFERARGMYVCGQSINWSRSPTIYVLLAKRYVYITHRAHTPPPSPAMSVVPACCADRLARFLTRTHP